MIELRRATIGWLRAVLAPNMVGALLAVLLVMAAATMLAAHHTIFGPAASRLFNYSEALQGFVVVVSVLACYYGLMRSVGFHPALDFRYHEWLKSSPWAPGRRLPKGPITPVWQDGVFLTAATVLTSAYAPETANPTASSLGPTIGMAGGLAAGWTAANFVTRNLVAIYGTLLAAAAAAHVLLEDPPVATAAACAAAAVVAYLGVVVGMRGYPWQLYPKDKNYVKKLFNPHDERQVTWQQTASVGWPYTQLLKPPKDYRVSAWRAVTEAMVVAAWIALFGRLIPSRDQEAIWILTLQLGMFLSVAKLASNFLLICPKLCLGERIARRQPILWRHDRLILEPALVGAAMAAIGWLWRYFWRVGWDPPHWIGAALAAAVGVWLCRRIGRNVDASFYTGHQMVAGVAPNAAFFKRLASPGE